MDVEFRTPTTSELPAMAELAAATQSNDRFHIIYLGTTAESITADVVAVENWVDKAYIAEQDGQLVGWMLADVDPDMGRVWWLGPFVAAAEASWDAIADELYQRSKQLLDHTVTEQELAFDDRSEMLTAWCVRHGFAVNTASVLLRLDPDRLVAPSKEHVVRPLADRDHDQVKALHEQAFAGTHTTPDALVVSQHPRLVIESATATGEVVGYVAFEMQSDGSGYLDYLAVAENQRGAGCGAALVAEACRMMFADGATYVHLTVREDNVDARALYAKLGFVEERVARPCRIGFDLG